jgi:hypothetical protein
MAAERMFRRGSHVLEYWLANAEGFDVSSGARRLGVVERVRVEPARGHARELVVRTPALHRRRRLAAGEFVAVDPAARRLEVLPQAPAAPTLGDDVRRHASVLQDAAQRRYGELAHGTARIARRAAEMWRQNDVVERE